jgi:hypothetical protein
MFDAGDEGSESESEGPAKYEGYAKCTGDEGLDLDSEGPARFEGSSRLSDFGTEVE